MSPQLDGQYEEPPPPEMGIPLFLAVDKPRRIVVCAAVAALDASQLILINTPRSGKTSTAAPNI